MPLDPEEHDAITSLHIYVPNPGDPFGTGNPLHDGNRGTVLNMGAAMGNLYTGFGVHTHGHIFLNALGWAHPDPDGYSWQPETALSTLPAHSRVTIQSTGQAVMQSINQTVFILAGGDSFVAANGDGYMTAGGDLTLSGGYLAPYPLADPGPGSSSTNELNPDTYKLSPDRPTNTRGVPNYLEGVNALNRWWNYFDGFAGTAFMMKGATELAIDHHNNEEGIGSFLSNAVPIFSEVLSTAGSVFSAVSGARRIALLNDSDTQARDNKAADRTQYSPLGGGINLFARNSILATAPASISMYSGTVSIGSISSTYWGAAAELFGFYKANVTAWNEVGISAGNDVKIVAGHEVSVMSRQKSVDLRARRIQIGFARDHEQHRPQAQPSTAVGIAEVGQWQAWAGMGIAAAVAGAADPVDAGVGAVLAGVLGAANAVLGEALTKRSSATASAAPRAPLDNDHIVVLDHHMSDDFEAGATGKQVVDPAKVSPCQEQTEDIFLKADKKIRLKSNDSIKIGAAKSAEIRVGSMLVQLNHVNNGADTVVIGRAPATENLYANATGEVRAPYIKVIKASSDAQDCIEIVRTAGSSPTKIVLSNNSIKLTVGNKSVTMTDQLNVNEVLKVTL